MKKYSYLGLGAVAILLLVIVAGKIDKGGLKDVQVAATYPAVTSPVNPISFWQFSGTTPAAQKTPTTGSQQFSGTENPTWTTGTGGKVGNFIDLSGSGNTAGNLTPSANGWAVEFLFKPSRTFEAGTIFSFGSNFKLEFQTPVGGNPNGSMARWKLVLNGTDYYIDLDGAGRKSLGYIANGDWHHFVVQYDPASSQKVQFWIDGQLPAGYSFTNTVSTSGSVKFSGMSSAEYTHCNCSLDQIALYDKALPPNLILEHSNNTNAGVAYSATTAITNVPTADSVAGVYNPLDFMAGTNLSSSSGQTPGVAVSVIDQLESYPLPRFKAGDALIPNVGNWLAYDYLANIGSSSISGTSLGNTTANHAKSKDINRQLATKWNYHIQVSNNTGSSNGFSAADQALANETQYITPGPNFIPIAATSFRAQLYTTACTRACISSQNLPNTHYLQNASGQFLDPDGNVATNNVKRWRPVSTYLSSYAPDGEAAKSHIQNLLSGIPNRVAQYPTRAIDLINDNGEVFPPYTAEATNNVVNNDPVVLAAKNASGLDAYTYVARQFYTNERAYVDKLKSIPAVANTTFTEYAIEGEHIYEFKWVEARKVNDPINGMYYSTPDFYIRYPWNWKYWSSAWHGWQWLVNSRNGELAAGDNLYSPFTSAGWDTVERNNVRPAQMLGFTKILAATGAEFFYPGVFNIEPNISDNLYPENYVWQASTPSYAQGVTSYYEDILRNGKLMRGDSTRLVYPPDTNPGFRFYTGNPGHLVVARKQNNVNRFVISGMENPWSNYQGNVPEESVADIMFGGDTYPSTTVTPTENLKFKVRRQGSTYIYDKTGASPVFYQLDGWHESSHPWHWSKDFNFEAEVYDSGSASRTTTVPAGTPAGDYTNFTTYINPASGSTTYNFEPRNATGTAAKTYYLWFNAKSASGTATGSIKIDSTANKTISTSATTFGWCNKDASGNAIVFTGVTPNSAHSITFTGTSPSFHFDKFILSENPSLNLGNCAGGGGTLDAVAPSLTIAAPVAANGTYLSTSNPLPVISGTASDNVGVTQVSWVNSLGGSGNATGTTSWSIPTTTLSNGNNVFTITARDAAGNITTASITVIYDNILPTSAMSSPASGATISGTVTISATATDNVAIDHVDFYSGSAQLIGGATNVSGTSYSRSWTPTVNGPTTVYAVAYDTSGNTKTSASVSVTVGNQVADTVSPVVSMTTPSNGATVSGINVSLSANATDNVGVSYVQFYLDNNIIPGASDSTGTSNVFNVGWNSTSTSNGNHTISVKAYDAAGNVTTSNSVSITVSNVVGMSDLIVQDIDWTPANPATGQAMTFKALVKNQGTVATPIGTIPAGQPFAGQPYKIGLLFTRDGDTANYTWSDTFTSSIAAGATVWLTANGGSNGASWNATSGAHTISVEVDDVNRITESNETNNTLSESFTIGTPSDTVAPTIAISSPTSSGAFNSSTPTLTTLSGTASDNVGVTQVSWVNSLGGSGNATGTTSWSVSNITLQTGSNVITVTARDAANNIKTAVITVAYSPVVNDTVAPTLTITSPANKSDVSNKTPVTFSATATDNNAVTEVKFFLGSTTGTPRCTLTSPTQAPDTYRCSFNVPSVFWGLAYSTINVQAKDAAGNVTTKSIQVR